MASRLLAGVELAGRPVSGEHGDAAVDEVLEQGDPGRLAERHDPLLGALAQDQDGVGREVDVTEAQAAELPDPDPGRVQELEDRPVAKADRVDRVGAGQQAVDLARLEHHRQTLGPAGDSQTRGRVVGHEPSARQEPEGRPQHRRLPGDRCGGKPPGPLQRQEPPEQQRVHLRRIGHPGPTGELQKLGHVAPIRPDGVHREPPLIPQMRDKRVQPMPRHRPKPIRIAVVDKLGPSPGSALARTGDRRPGWRSCSRLGLDAQGPGPGLAARSSLGGLPPGRSFGGVLWAG